MSLDTRYVPLGALQQYFPDKDTGGPLIAGIVSFFSDVSRTQPKDVFIISGTPPNYIYINIGAEIELSSVGTFSYNGNDILPYLFPYDDEGNIQLYYVTCTSALGSPQFTREGIPNIADETASSEIIKNFIPNGQFLIHNDLPNDGLIVDDVTILAQGGWSFVRSTGSTATDYVTFERIAAPLDVPTANPRYQLRVNTQVADSGDTEKDVRIKFLDVNKFASQDQAYTFSFTANTETGTTVAVKFSIIKNYGSGGSAPTKTVVDDITITPTSTIYNTEFIFGTNTDKTIGPNDDDYVELSLTFPLTIASDIVVVDWVLAAGGVPILSFPQTTNAEFSYQSLVAPTPAYDGSDLYCPLRLTPTGLGYDKSDIGKIFAAMYLTPEIGELACDGASYITADYSDDGIPYSRLQSKLF